MKVIGVRKILKKFDKCFGHRFIDYYVTTRSNYPYSQLQQVFKHVGIGAVVGALSRSLTRFQSHGNSYLSIYDKPGSMLALQDPVVDGIKDAVERLINSTSFLRFLRQHARGITRAFRRVYSGSEISFCLSCIEFSEHFPLYGQLIHNCPNSRQISNEPRRCQATAKFFERRIQAGGHGFMMTQYTQILGMRVGTVIKPIVDYLMNLGFPIQVVARMIEKRPHILGYDLEEK